MKLYVLYHNGNMIAYSPDVDYINEVATACPQSVQRVYNISYDVTIPDSLDGKISAVKELRNLIPGLGLKQSKDLVEMITAACDINPWQNTSLLEDRVASLEVLVRMKDADIARLETERTNYHTLCNRMVKLMTPEQLYALMVGEA